jgi:2-polyprenyl-3-methyl-5-hydroxy-6-metoxy-1,4-benzoquinol methylase
LLEVGCANGKLTHALLNYKITGIDLEASFIDIAKHRYPEVVFYQMNMLDIDQLNETYDGIICFGNTLVHINHHDIQTFLEKAYDRLNKNGKILIQILNYEYILDHEIKKLPLIDNEIIRFERSYEHGDAFLFNTKLTIKIDNSIIENSVELTPITQKALLTALENVGFKNATVYGNFSEAPITPTSLPLIVKAEK